MKIPFCQSCGMPLTSEELFGSNEGGSRNEEYCTYCYKDGAFTDPNATLESMTEICVPHVVAGSHMSEKEARDMLGQFLPTLKRWS